MIKIPKCYDCKYYYGEFKCKAYPNGIPSDILFNKYDHTKPYSGDNGIRFEPIEEKKSNDPTND